MAEATPKPLVPTTAKVVIISSVMFVFISYWRVAAIVLCDLASTAFYIGGIVEHSIGPAAPWFIVGVMLFSYAVRSVYIESCSMFVRGGVYRIVKEALGRTLAKVAVSALLFDYVLTGPISGVSAGQYIMSLILELLAHFSGNTVSPPSSDLWKSVGSVLIACAITIYFFRLNVVGIHESSDKALKIMIVTTIMGVTILGWSILTLVLEGPRNAVTFQPTFGPKLNPSTGQMESPLGFLNGTSFGDQLLALSGWNWLSVIGVIGFFLAFGHSVLAMSGEETLAQIYREVESPKLKNFKRAAFIVFIYSLLLTGGISVLAIVIIPDDVRMVRYGDNLIGGLAMSVYGPPLARLSLNAFVVVVGSLILAGAVNTAIIGSNGVLNRVAEDGVIPDWFSKPHPRYGTTYRLLYVILGFQVFTILVSHGDVLLLGEAYAFGVVWSFVFNCLAMLVLRFRDPDRPRGFKVPLNVTSRGTEIPIGLGLIFVILLISAVMNVLTKEIATKAGVCFTVVLFLLFAGTEYFRRRKTGPQEHEHLDQFNEITTDSVTAQTLDLKHPHRTLMAIRSPTHLAALDKVLEETDPETTDLVVMTAQVRPVGGVHSEPVHIDVYERELVNAVEKRAEAAGKTVVPIIVSTNNALHAVMQTAQAIGAQELILGTSEKFTPEQQLDHLDFYWTHLHGGHPTPLTVRIVGGNREFFSDFAGGSRTPKVKERKVKSLDELRAASNGVNLVLLLYDGTQESSDLFQSLVMMIDPHVGFQVIETSEEAKSRLDGDIREARRLGRVAKVVSLPGTAGFVDELIRVILDADVDIVIARMPLASLTGRNGDTISSWSEQVLRQTDCRVFFAAESPETDVRHQ
jgi:amino acid transporter/nucleotide-binding universal stress UspA family protein